MAKMTTLQIRIEKELKNALEKKLRAAGFNLSSGLRLIMHCMIAADSMEEATKLFRKIVFKEKN